jgi:hypothetical protein
MNPGRDPRILWIVGALAGWLGVSVSTAAIANHVPGFNLFVPIESLRTFNPLHIDLFGPQYSDFELADRFRHNEGSGSGPAAWKVALFQLQTIAASAWDALILSACVWIVGIVVSLPMKAFFKT